MSWATELIESLKLGMTVQCRPRGHSMTGLINDGQLVTLAPLHEFDPVVGDVILCVVGKYQYVHKIVEIKDGKFLIGNNKGRTNGWIERSAIFGRMTKVEP